MRGRYHRDYRLPYLQYVLVSIIRDDPLAPELALLFASVGLKIRAGIRDL